MAKQIGVSHTAPYNHFADKQALLAAISTAGYEQLYPILRDAFENSKSAPETILLEVAWAYLQFALDNPAKFKLMFSGALEEERDHPDYEAISQKSITLFEEIISYCQEKGQLPAGDLQIVAIKVWSLVHGFAYLMLENQFPGEYMKNQDIKETMKNILS